MLKNLAALAALVAIAGCGSEDPAEKDPAVGPEEGAVHGDDDHLILREMIITDPARAHVHDDALVLDASGVVYARDLADPRTLGRIHRDGRVEANGRVVATLAADGRLLFTDFPDDDVVIDEDGSVYVAGELDIAIGRDGILTGPFVEVENATAVHGPRDGRRAAMLAFVVLSLGELPNTFTPY